MSLRATLGLTAMLAIQTATVERAPAWTKPYVSAEPTGPLHPVAVALSPTAKCAAVAHEGVVSVFDVSGQPRWSWNYAKVNRYIQPASLALSPTCDAVAVVGTSGYKYTWLAQRRGGARPLATTSTPMGAAFDHTGEHLALGTAGQDVFLFTLTGRQKWKTTFRGIVQDLEFSDDDRFVLVRGWGIGVLRLDGTVVWSAGEDKGVASRDLSTFVTWSEPPHGPGIGSTVALDGQGGHLWSTRKFSSTVGAIVSSTGDRIAAWINENQKPVEEDGYRSDHPMTLQVLTRSGDLVTTIPAQRGTLLAFSPDGTRILLRTKIAIQEVDLEGRVRQSIPLDNQDLVWPTVIVAGDYSGLLVLQGRLNARVQWFHLR